MDQYIIPAKYGMKWYTFYTKVRPWFCLVFGIAFFADFDSIKAITDPSVGSVIILSWLLIISVIIYVILNIVLFYKVQTEQPTNLYCFIRSFLIYELCYNIYNNLLECVFAYLNEPVFATAKMITYIIVSSVLFYINIHYFKKRLAPKSIGKDKNSTDSINYIVNKCNEYQGDNEQLKIFLKLCVEEEFITLAYATELYHQYKDATNSNIDNEQKESASMLPKASTDDLDEVSCSLSDANAPKEKNSLSELALETPIYENKHHKLEDQIAEAKNASDTKLDVTINKTFFCRKCGTEILSDSLFCYKCGTKVETPND